MQNSKMTTIPAIDITRDELLEELAG